jgi:hypothetical protein
LRTIRDFEFLDAKKRTRLMLAMLTVERPFNTASTRKWFTIIEVRGTSCPGASVTTSALCLSLVRFFLCFFISLAINSVRAEGELLVSWLNYSVSTFEP